MENMGVFRNASPVSLLVEQIIGEVDRTQEKSLPQDENGAELAKAGRPKPVLLESIQLIDSTLRKRCLDLFADFEETKQHDRFDTVIAEATRILEDRLRQAIGVKASTGDDLANQAFGGSVARLRASEVESEQKAVLLFFKGIFGHIRNPSHHKLLGDLTPERTIQILGMIDYAIYLVETCEKSTSDTPGTVA